MLERARVAVAALACPHDLQLHGTVGNAEDRAVLTEAADEVGEDG